MNDDFKKLKHYLVRLNTVVNELDVLEDWVGVDYSEISIDFIRNYTPLLKEVIRSKQ